jgi:LysR family transcriptional regulator for metE and metH
VRIDVGATSDPVASLLAGRLELALVSDPIRDRRVVARPLFEDELLVVMSPRHPLAKKSVVEPSDFATETLLSYASKEESTVYQRVLIPAGVAPASLLQVQLTEAIIELAKADVGIGVLARWAVEPHVRAGTLKALPLTRRRYKRTWSAATLKDLMRVPYVREFIDLLAEHRPVSSVAAVTSLRRGA